MRHLRKRKRKFQQTKRKLASTRLSGALSQHEHKPALRPTLHRTRNRMRKTTTVHAVPDSVT